jgi:hypothetical protein
MIEDLIELEESRRDENSRISPIRFQVNIKWQGVLNASWETAKEFIEKHSGSIERIRIFAPKTITDEEMIDTTLRAQEFIRKHHLRLVEGKWLHINVIRHPAYSRDLTKEDVATALVLANKLAGIPYSKEGQNLSWQERADELLCYDYIREGSYVEDDECPNEFRKVPFWILMEDLGGMEAPLKYYSNNQENNYIHASHRAEPWLYALTGQQHNLECYDVVSTEIIVGNY